MCAASFISGLPSILIMSSAVQRATVLSGTVTRTWLVPYEGATHFAQLRHNTVSGFRYAMFDGRELPGTEGTSTILSQSGAADVLVVKLGEAALEVTIAASHGVFVYGCVRMCSSKRAHAGAPAPWRAGHATPTDDCTHSLLLLLLLPLLPAVTARHMRPCCGRAGARWTGRRLAS